MTALVVAIAGIMLPAMAAMERWEGHMKNLTVDVSIPVLTFYIKFALRGNLVVEGPQISSCHNKI